MDAIALLIQDHKRVRKLLNELNDTNGEAVKTRRDLTEEIATELKAHTQIEEEIFYPAYKQACNDAEDDKLYFEALEEHRAARELVLPDLLNTDVESEQFSGRAKVLKELIEHHADEEEEDMFPRAKEIFAIEDLNALGEEMEARRKELLSEEPAT